MAAPPEPGTQRPSRAAGSSLRSRTLNPLPEHVVALAVDPRRARVFEHGWQSWSPSTTYRIGQRPYRPANANFRRIAYRPEAPAPPDAFQGEGLLAIDPGDGGPVHVFAAVDGREDVPSVRVERHGSQLAVTASGAVEHLVDDDGGGRIPVALARWADRYVARVGAPPVRPAPTIWCSWYQYFTEVTEHDVLENLAAIDRLDVPVDVLQIDDGYQREIGDWLTPSRRFRSLPDLADRISAHGRRVGIWAAPFLVGARSDLAADHPEWLVRDAHGPVGAGRNWGQQLFALDSTHPAAAAYLQHAFRTFRSWGVDLYKLDFLYAGAVPGRRHEHVTALQAYRRGLALIRDAIGPGYLLGCGAPLLPSVGLVDALRVGPDVGLTWEPPSGDYSQPSVHAAMVTGAARAFQHGRFWANDPDCLLARPGIPEREQWADHLIRYGGLRGSSDRLRALDAWGLETTRRVLRTPVPATLVPA